MKRYTPGVWLHRKHDPFELVQVLESSADGGVIIQTATGVRVSTNATYLDGQFEPLDGAA